MLRIEALQEIALADLEALNAAARTVFSGESGTMVYATRPKSRLFHLATGEEAKRHPGLAGAQKFASSQPQFAGLPPTWFTALQARDGAAPVTNPWLLEVASTAAHPSTITVLETARPKTMRSVSASFNAVGALIAASATPVWLIEIGELASHALLVSRSGVLASGPVSLNADRIAEAVQTELGLKFRGSALKLFFNPDYDFSEVGPKIAARLAVALKTELTALRGVNAAPAALTCAGLPAGQQWFTAQFAAALGCTPFVPDLKTTSITFASPELEATLSPAWFGLLRLIVGASRSEPITPWWQAEWIKIDAQVAVAAPAASVAPPAKAPTPAPTPAPAVVAPKSAAPTPPVAKPAAPTKPAASTPAASASSASYPPKPAPAAKQATPSKKNEAPAPKSAPAPVAPSTRAAALEADEPAAPETPIFKKPLVLGAAALVVLIAVGGFFYMQSQKQEAALAEEKARIAKNLQEVSEKARQAQQQA